MWEKIVDIIKELLDIFKNWAKSKETKKEQEKIDVIEKKVEDGKVEDLNKIWKDDL